MKQTVADIIRIMDRIAPRSLAESWDNVGLQVGQGDWPVRSIWVALDPAPAVVAAACENRADLLITHHPLLFRPVKSIDFATPTGAVVRMAATHQTAIYAAHTNLDAVADGLNDILAQRIGLRSTEVLVRTPEPSPHGIGRIGTLAEPATLVGFAAAVRDALKAAGVRYVGDPERVVSRVAVCTGSGGGLMDAFLSSAADVFVTGDVRYHDARTVEWAERGLVDIGHFASEHLMVRALADRLRQIARTEKLDLVVQVCELEKDPFLVV